MDKEHLTKRYKDKKIFWQGFLAACEIMKHGRCPFEEHKAAILMLDIIEREQSELAANRAKIIDGQTLITLPCRSGSQIVMYNKD